MPYRVDIAHSFSNAFDVLVELGALDVEASDGGLAAILPDSVTQDMLAAQLGNAVVSISPVIGRDDGAVWMLTSRPVLLPSLSLAPVQLIDSDAFGTGYHPTTALCLEALGEIIGVERPDCVLDVGTGSGILAVAALNMGVPRAVGLDIDARALQIATENARVNRLADRIEFVFGGPDSVNEQYPVVVANLLAASLIEMAPVLVRRLRKGGELILSGIHESLAGEVRRAYEHCGLRAFALKTRAKWTALIARAPW